MHVSLALRSRSPPFSHWPWSQPEPVLGCDLICECCSVMQEVTPRANDSLVSFGERLSTRLFSAFLRAQV